MLPPPPEQPRLASDSERTRELELELRRVRAAATAARLEARAAEIELLLRRAARRAAVAPEAPAASGMSAVSASAGPSDAPSGLSIADHLSVSAGQPPTQADPLNPAPPPVVPSEAPPAANGRVEREDEGAALAPPQAPPIGLPSGFPSGPPHNAPPERRSDLPADPPPDLPFKREPTRAPATPVNAEAEPPATAASAPPAIAERIPSPEPLAPSPSWRLDLPEFSFAGPSPVTEPPQDLPASMSQACGEAGSAPRRRRPAAWIVSTLAHAVILILLAATTMSVARPKDQIAIEAATSPAEAFQIEAVPLEQAERPEQTAPQTPLPLATDPSPIGMVAASEIEVDAPELTAPPSDAFESLSELSAAATAISDGSPDLSSQFFGVAGGGNHFVYLVDNSGSMASVAKDGFDVARQELLASIAALKPHQRFYVIFFGEEMLRMRISDPGEPEPRSVYATPENKEALRRWAMGITMQPGRWPEEPLRFAFELRPDVIFLLTDGEMSQKVEPMIREHNLVESLFDGPRPRSIIHTIGFYSRDGAQQMQQIAAANGGTYRFVPPPPRK